MSSSGKRKPLILNATHPALRSVSKFGSDRMTAIGLYNLTYDYALGFVFKYLKQKDYDEYNAKFGKPFIDLSSIVNVRGKVATLKGPSF